MRHLILTALLLTACAGGEDTNTDCADTDRDGVCDANDLCTGDDATGDSDSDGICDALDLCAGDDSLGDADLDLICDGADDLCVGEDGTGDTDGDGVCDDRDLCDGDDALGDADNDDVCDGAADACFGDDATGDTDADGVCNDSDQCVGNDAVGDSDNDGSCDDTDLCTGDDTTGDSDADAVCDDEDACPGENDLTADPDNDGVCGAVDLCDGNDATGDTDQDGVCDDSDACTGNDAQPDTDGDGICEDIDLCNGDDATFDTDEDGVCNDLDACIGNDATGDTDGDGVCDSSDNCLGDDATGDLDRDGVCDDVDACTGNDAIPDTDGDGVCEDIDACLGNDASGDNDNDGTCDDLDACIGNDQTNNDDGDAYCNDVDQCDGDDAVGDFDNDGLCQDIDPCLGQDNLDDDADGICDGENDMCVGDDSAGDRDGDGVCDDIDLCYGLDRLGDSDGDNLCGSGTIYYVIPGSVSRIHDGLTWANAFRSPALADEVAQPGDTVFLRSYTDGTTGYPPTRIVASADVQWIGGFQGTETHPDQRPTDRGTGLPIPTITGDVESVDRNTGWVVIDGYVDAIELKGYPSAAADVSGSSVMNNIIVGEAVNSNSVGSPPGLFIDNTNDVRISNFRCQGRDVTTSRCLTMSADYAEVWTSNFKDVSASNSAAMIDVNSGTLHVNNAKTSDISARLFDVNSTSELVVTNSDLSGITTFHTAAVVSASNATVRIEDTLMTDNSVTGGIDIEGGLISVFQTDLTLNRVHMVNTALLNSESVVGGVIYVNNSIGFSDFDMRDSSIHGTSFDYSGSVDGGLIYLNRANSFILSNTFGPLDSPFDDDRVQGAHLYLDTIQATIANNAMWTEHDVPLQTEGQQNVAWVELCAPINAFSANQGPTSFIELEDSPFAAPSGHRLLLAANSPCVDQGRTATADAFDIWWPGRMSQVGTTRDTPPVDLGAHYNP